MKRIPLIVVLFLASLSVLFSQTKVSVDFKYANVTFETTQLPDGKIEKKTIDRGQTDFDLQLRDLIEFMLLEKKYSITAEGAKDADYSVKLHSVLLPLANPLYYSIEVEIYSAGDKLVNRKLIIGAPPGMQWLVQKAAEEVVKYLTEVIKR